MVLITIVTALINQLITGGPHIVYIYIYYALSLFERLHIFDVYIYYIYIIIYINIYILLIST